MRRGTALLGLLFVAALSVPASAAGFWPSVHNPGPDTWNDSDEFGVEGAARAVPTTCQYTSHSLACKMS